MTRHLLRIARLLVAIVAIVAGSVSIAKADHASVTLGYTRAANATSCPDEGTFRGLVAARLGYDPFVGTGALSLAVEFKRRGNELVGRLNLTAKDDEKRGQRTLRARADDCFELATSMALVAAVAVDPDAVQARAGQPTPAPAPSAPPQAEPPPPPPPVPKTEPVAPPSPAPAPAIPPPPPVPVVDERSDSGVRFELSGLIPIGIVPAPRGGVRAGAALGLGRWSLGAQAEFLFPSSRDNPAGAGAVSAYVVDGALVPCLHPVDSESWNLAFCAKGALGVLHSTATSVTRAAPTSDWFATVGPRAALALMLSRAFGLGVSAEAPVALSRVHLHIEEGGQRREAWVQSSVGFIGAVSLLVRLE